MPSMTRSNMTACMRCRRKKKRCDQRLPRCSLCESAGAECVSYDAVTKRHVPRSYVHNLEERIAVLELKLREYGIHDLDLEETPRSTTTPTTFNGAQRHEGSFAGRHAREHKVPDMDIDNATFSDDMLDTVLSLTQGTSTEEPALCQILLTELTRPKSATHVVAKAAHEQGLLERKSSIDVESDLDISPTSLPTKDGAQSLVKAYFQFANQSMPVLHEPTFDKKLEMLYSMPRTVDFAQVHTSAESQMAVFFVCEVFAVALLILQKHDPSRIPISLADRYHKTALIALNKAGLPYGLVGVQALLLVAQYSYHHPTVWAVWKTMGAALRLAVELGLHRDMSLVELDVLTLDNMRKVFWSAYTMDINVSLTRKLPLSLSDGAITAKFPSQENDECITSNGIVASDDTVPKPKRVGLHLFRYRQIQSEMQAFLYEKSSAARTTIDWTVWQQQMHQRIQRWYDDTPRVESLTHHERKNIENFEVTYQSALFYLYHPSRSIPSPSEGALLALTDAATSMIQLYRRFFTQRHLTIYWHAVENLFSAGTALLWSYVTCPLVQERITLRNLETLVHTCSSVLWGMVEHFPDYKGKRDAFDMVASRTLADLTSSLSNSGGADTFSVHDNVSNSDRNDTRAGTESTATIWQHGPQIPLSAMVSEGHHLFADTSGSSAERPHNQYPQLNSSMRYSIPDFNEVSFDWEGLENASGFATPSWL